MVYATHITMKPSYSTSSYYSPEARLLEIDEIYLTGLAKAGWYPKDKVHDLVINGTTICVYISPWPILIAAISQNHEKYVRSAPNNSTQDNLLNLPRG